MRSWLQPGLVMVIVPLALAFAFLVEAPLVVSAWPFPGTTSMSYVLMASMLAAAAASTGVPLVLRRDAALVGVGIDTVATFVPMTVFAVLLVSGGGGGPFGVLVALTLAGLVFGIALVVAHRRRVFIDSRPMPAAVRWSFALFVISLVAVGGLLLAAVPNVLPWQVTPDISRLFACMFLGASTYFAYGLVRPTWDNAIGQLAGFLAYDVVLIVPFLSRLPGVEDRFRIGLIAYLGVVLLSGALAIWYLFLAPKWRLVRPSDPQVSAGV